MSDFRPITQILLALTLVTEGVLADAQEPSATSATHVDGTVSYQLIARSLPEEPSEVDSADQILYSVSGMHEGPPFDGGCGVVEWIGDLDGDGRWDFIVNQTDHYNVNQPALFLSTLAGEGEIAGKAAEFRTTGC
jgi:hypothetical protein